MEPKIEKIAELVGKIRKDCEELQEKGLLTERGKGQLDIIKLIEEELEK